MFGRVLSDLKVKFIKFRCLKKFMVKKALILIDFENEWINEDSEYFVGNITETVNRVNKLIGYCRNENYKIIFIRHVEKDSKKEFVENSNNVEIMNEINKDNSDVLVTKYKISPFYQTNLQEELDEIEEVIVSGILTNLCVRSFIQDAYDRDFVIKVIKDCCVSFDQETQDFTFKDLKDTRDEIEFLNLDEFVQ
jgi:nicotinamidase-related amidase